MPSTILWYSILNLLFPCCVIMRNNGKVNDQVINWKTSCYKSLRTAYLENVFIRTSLKSPVPIMINLLLGHLLMG